MKRFGTLFLVVSVLSSVVAGALAAVLHQTPSEGCWIQHTIRTADSVEALAARFGVTASEIRSWNRLDDDALTKGKSLRIQARHMPPPQQLERALLSDATRWDDAAALLGVDEAMLRAWNPRYRGYETRLPERAHLSLYRDSGIQHYPLPALDSPFPDIPRIEGGESVGRPQIGRLRKGVQLPDSPDYEIQLKNEAFGSTTTIWHLQRGLAEFRRATGYRGQLRIGTISQEGGKALPRHASHQSGRDADIRLPAMASAPEHGQLYVTQVDWHATWALIDTLVRTGGVQQIFLEENYHRRLEKAARRLGADETRIDWVLQHVGHARGHRSHLHIRFVCAPEESSCRG